MGIRKFKEQPNYINDFSKALLDGFYLKEGETFNDAIARASEAFCYGDYELAQRIYEAAWHGWFMFASPILSNAPQGHWVKSVTRDVKTWDKEYNWVGETTYAMPISCFALEVPDTISGQMKTNVELAALSVAGGGVGLHNAIRATTDVAPGPIPYMKTMDAIIGYYKQGRTRRGACAYYMDVSHPDIMEHIKFRTPSGGDSARKADNRVQFHNAVNVTDEFVNAVVYDLDFELVCPNKGEVRGTLKARYIWEEILETRALTGEPYIFKIDTANKALPKTQIDKGLKIKGSNICIEVCLPTDKLRTFVCCLSSLNVAKEKEWPDTLVPDLTRYLDNVLQYFIDNAPDELSKAVYSAKMERAIGIGTLGWHYYLQSENIPMEGGGFGSAIQETHKIYSRIKEQAVKASQQLAKERGEPEDMVGSGLRNSALLAIAPNSNNAVILGESPSIEAISGNAYSHSTRAGTFFVKNPHLEALLNVVCKERLLISDSKQRGWLEDQWKNIHQNNGSVQHLDYLTDHEKAVFKTAAEIDQHWVVEQADARAQYVCQSQSLNLFFPAGCDRKYFNSVHLKALTARYLKSMYYARMERGINADVAKEIERKAIEDWKPEEGEDCVACSG